jgi:sugar lactone lactonase YvrE
MIDVALDLRLELGEGPLWDARRGVLLFVDIMQGDLHVFDPGSGSHRRIHIDRPIGAVACSDRGDWIGAAGQGFVRIDPETGALTEIATAAPGRSDVRMNDGYVDFAGRFWAGTLSLVKAREAGALYRLSPGGRVETMLENVTTSNGIDWSPDGQRMYYVDTGTRRVDVFDTGLDGVIANRRPFVDLAGEIGRPDGLVVDAEGGVWVALWQGGAIRRYAPDGRLDQQIPVPASLVTKCAFGGADLGDLYITTASRDLTASERQALPHAGSLFRTRPGVKGQPPRLFRDR